MILQVHYFSIQQPFSTFLSGSVAAVVGALASFRLIKELPQEN
jgi:hypothetical protein